MHNGYKYMIIAHCLGAWNKDLEGKNNLEEAYNYFRRNKISDELKPYKYKNLFDLCTKEKAYNANFNKAFFYINKVKKDIPKKNKDLLFYYWQGVGSIFLEQMNFKKAYKSWEIAYNLVKNTKDKHQERYCDILCDYAYIKAMFNDKDTNEYLSKAIDISNNYNFSRNSCRAYINKANHLFYNENNIKESLLNIQSAISIAKNIDDDYMLMISHFSNNMFTYADNNKYTYDNICTWALDLLSQKQGDNRIKNIIIFYFSIGIVKEKELKQLNNLYIDNYLNKWKNNNKFVDIEKDNLYYKNGKYAIYY